MKKSVIAGLAAGIIVVSGGVVVGYEFSKDSEAQAPSESTDNKKNKSEMTEQQLVSDYEKRVTTYDPKIYPIPKNNIGRIDSKVECLNGLGGDTKGLGKGLFDEPLFIIMTEASEYEGYKAFAPYSRVTNVVNDVIFEADIDTFDRQVMNQRYLMSGIPSKRHIITTDGFFYDSYSHMPVKGMGYPVGYLISQAGLFTGTALVNDQCDKNLGKRKYEWQKIDLSGKPISYITTTIPTTQTIVSPYGMYSYTTNSYLYLQGTTGEYIASNVKLLQKFNRAEHYPKGSYIYLPKNIEVYKEVMIQDLNEYTAIEDFNMDSYIAQVAQLSGVNPKVVSMVETSSGDTTLYVPRHKIDNTELPNAAPVLKMNGKYYPMVWTLPNKTEINYKKGVGDLAYMNKTAHDHTVRSMKSSLQGLQLSANTLTDGSTKEMAESRQAMYDRRVKELEKMFGPEFKDIPPEMLADLKDPSKGLTITGR